MNDMIRPASPYDPASLITNAPILDWFERDDGIGVLGFRINSRHGLEREVDWHSHRRAQLICVEEGLLTTRTQDGTWSLPPGCAGWMPAGQPHTVDISGPLRGWGLILTAAMATRLPADPCVIAISDLAHALALRVIEWPPLPQPDLRQQHMMEVLLDELAAAPRQRMHLPLPRDRRLLRIAAQLIADPADDRGLEDWARWAGLSPRSLSRHFRQETTLSFAQWRQQARLAESLRRLADGASVGDVAHGLGFSSPSAFVGVFRRHFGLPPGRWLSRAGASGLASPPASG